MDCSARVYYKINEGKVVCFELETLMFNYQGVIIYNTIALFTLSILCRVSYERVIREIFQIDR